MKKVLQTLLLTCLTVLICTGNTWASSYDYADATGYNNTNVYATNATWNRLGTEWTGEASAAAVANNTDADDGVSWSINGGAYGHDAITVGDTVTFQFVLSKVQWGRHYADYLKVWIDWNDDKDFTDAGEMIYAVAYNFISHTEPDGSSTQFLNAAHTAQIVATYYSNPITFDDVDADDYWLRARVVCNPDAGSLNNVSSTAHYDQGEIEDWKLTVNNKVPEPAFLLLLSMGLLGLVGVRRKINK